MSHPFNIAAETVLACDAALRDDAGKLT